MNKPGGNTAVVSSYDAFHARLDNGGRSNVERHLTVCRREPSGGHLKLWKRLAGYLATLTPHVIRTFGQRAVQFYEADGNYRRQLFAIEDLRDGKLAVYTANVLEAAVTAGVLINGSAPDHHPILFALGGAPDEQLRIESLTASNTSSAPEYYRHMLDWNRKALRITLSTDATPAQIAAAEALCALAVEK
ncbi:MAG: hypothetical protein JWO87_3495 [Phycisphaerales bacterium]|nr:hypothetical protein [Phycisphaerales bacterium]